MIRLFPAALVSLFLWVILIISVQAVFTAASEFFATCGGLISGIPVTY